MAAKSLSTLARPNVHRSQTQTKMQYNYENPFRRISRALSSHHHRHSDYNVYEIITKMIERVKEEDRYTFLTESDDDSKDALSDFPPPNLLCQARSVDALMVLLSFLPREKRSLALFDLRCADGSSLFLNTNWETFCFDQFLHESIDRNPMEGRSLDESFGMFPMSDLNRMLLHERDREGQTILLKIVKERLDYWENEWKPQRKKFYKLCDIIQGVMKIVDKSKRLHLLLMADSNGITISKQLRFEKYPAQFINCRENGIYWNSAA